VVLDTHATHTTAEVQAKWVKWVSGRTRGPAVDVTGLVIASPSPWSVTAAGQVVVTRSRSGRSSLAGPTVVRCRCGRMLGHTPGA
jgi:TPP-dependent pyruvate/acetoin dehydrogenase alpha subunit